MTGTAAPQNASRSLHVCWSCSAPHVLVVAALATAAIPRLPPGICYEDSGDLQAASVFLGIAHPPGYAPLVSVLHLFARLPWPDPAYSVSLACCLAGIIAVLCCVQTQIMLGVNRWIAAVLGLALAAHPEFFDHLIIPEVYICCLAAELGAALLLIRHLGKAGRARLWIAALLLGFVIANRISVVLVLPFFVAALLMRRPSGGGNGSPGVLNSRRPRPLCVVLVTLCLAAPILYAHFYVLARDRPATPYNYLEQYQRDTKALPAFEAGWGARIERAHWLLSANQYQLLLSTRPADIKHNCAALVRRIASGQYAIAICAGAVALAGAFRLWRRDRITLIILGGIAASSFVFACMYGAPGWPADLLPFLAACTMFIGTAVSDLDLTRHRLLVRFGPIGLAGTTAGLLIWSASSAPHGGAQPDARPFLGRVDLATLPAGAVILSGWTHSPPLWYGLERTRSRGDVVVLNADLRRWPDHIAALDAADGAHHPIFAVEPITPPPNYTIEHERGLWRLRPVD